MTPETFLTIAELFPEAALLVTASGAVRAANAAAARLLGAAGGSPAGRTLADLTVTPLADLSRFLNDCSRSAQKVVGALAVRAADGPPVPCRAEGKVVQPRDGDAEALLLLRLVPREGAVQQFLLLNQRIEELSREIARRRQAEEELLGQKEWLRVTLNSIGDAVIATDSAGRVTFLNPTAEALTGWSELAAAGRPIGAVFDILSEETRAPAANPVNRVLSEGRLVGLANHTLLRARDGTERPIDDCGAPIRDAAGRVVGAVLVFRDVTERRALENELRDRADRLAEADRRKDDWFTLLAHELRAPLHPLGTAARVLQTPAAGADERRRAADVVGRQVGHLARIVGDLLDVNRLSRGQLTLTRGRLDLARLVRTAAEDYRPVLEQAGLTLTVQTPPTPVWAEADGTRLTQVVSNLLDNARKFTGAGGRVEVVLEADPAAGRAALRVCDSGDGIEPGMLPRLFQALNQADRSLDRTKGGLGLGLALVRGLVEMHGGTAEARSGGPGRGAEFLVCLPMLAEPAALAGSTAAPPPAARPRRILVIEDNRDSADSLRMLLELLGHEVRVAYTGPDGVRAADQWRPDVVLCDIGLPGLDGYGVAGELHRLSVSARALLVALTGYGSPEDRERTRRAGFQHHLTKPADPAALLQLLGHLPAA